MSSASHADAAADAHALASAIEEAGCVLTPLNHKDVLAASGVSASHASAAMNELATLGETVFPAQGILYFKSPECLSRSPEDFNDPRLVEFVSLIEGHGCKMDETAAVEVLPGAGFDKDEVKTIAHKLQAAELARFGDGEFVLTTENCR